MSDALIWPLVLAAFGAALIWNLTRTPDSGGSPRPARVDRRANGKLADAVRRVVEGDAVFSPRLAGFVLDAFAGELPEDEVDPELDQLTAREREVCATSPAATSTRR